MANNQWLLHYNYNSIGWLPIGVYTNSMVAPRWATKSINKRAGNTQQWASTNNERQDESGNLPVQLHIIAEPPFAWRVSLLSTCLYLSSSASARARCACEHSPSELISNAEWTKQVN